MTALMNRVKRLRESAGLDQRDAASLSGLSQSTWSRIESGAREPKLGEVVGIAAALGCLTSTILGNSELGGRLVTAMRKSDDSADVTSISEDIEFLLEVESELHAAGYIR